MTSLLRDEDAQVLRFGGGRNSRASEDQIHEFECTDGENFVLDPGNGEFRPRGAFDLVGTAPNGSEIRGFVTLRKTDGTVSMLVQAGAQVYQWDGANFSAVGSVAASAQIRGTKDAFWPLADKVLISDLNLAEEIHEWDGTTFQESSFFEADGSTAFSAFRCKYIVVENERAFYGNIYESAQNFPHLLVSSQRGDYSVVSASQRPSDALGADAPWFLPVPQLKPINGLAFAFGVLAISQNFGAFEQLAGSTAKDYNLNKLYDGSGAAGFESVISTENDIIYGAPSRIESLKSTDKYGDVETDDISFKIRDDIEDFDDWTLIYNPRVKRVYCIPSTGNEIHVLHTDFIGSPLSPWSKWTTQHSFSFQPTASMLCRDPVDGLNYVFMGDGNGNVYRLEGSSSGDAGSADIRAWRDSILFKAPLDLKAFHVNGLVMHRKRLNNTLTLTSLAAGKHVMDYSKDISLSAVAYDTPYNGAVYYGGNYYYGASQQDRLVYRSFAFPGQVNGFQIRTEVQGANEFAVPEVRFRYDQSSG